MKKHALLILFIFSATYCLCQQTRVYFNSDSSRNKSLVKRNANINFSLKNQQYRQATTQKSLLRYSPEGFRNKKNSTLNPTGISLVITTVQPNCQFDFGTIIISPAGGLKPYLFSVNGIVQNNGYYPSLLPDKYTIVVTDASGKSVSDTIVLADKFNSIDLNSSVVITPSSCTSWDGQLTLIAKGGTPPYTYSADFIHFQTSNNFYGLTQGNFIFFVKDANGCFNSFQFVNGSNSCSILNTGSGYGGAFNLTYMACTNEGSIVADTTNGHFKNYQFSLDSIHWQTNPVFTGLAPALYHLYEKDSMGNLAIFAFEILQSCNVSLLNVNELDASCKQNSGAITVKAVKGQLPYSYSIDGIHFQADSTFTGLAAGDYAVTVMDANGSIASTTATVYDKCPKLSVDISSAICGNKNGTITAIGKKGVRPYQFSIDGIHYKKDTVFTGLDSGMYKIYMMDAQGFTDSVTVNVSANCLQLSTVVTKTTCGNKNGSIAIAGAGGKPPYLYSVDGVNFQSNNIFTNLDSGIYKVYIQDADLVTSFLTDTILNIAGPTFTATTQTALCDGTNGGITIHTTGGTSPFVYSLDGIHFQNSNQFSGDTAGSYVVRVIDSNNCIISDIVLLSKYPTPYLQLGNDTTLCTGESLLLNAPSDTAYKYQWQDNSVGANFFVHKAGSYWVTVTNQYQCNASDTIHVAVRPLPAFSLGNDTSLCKGQVLHLQVTVPNAGYLWSNGSNAASLNIQQQGLYWLTVSDSGCNKRDSIIVDFKPIPTVALGDDTTLCTGNTLQLNAANNNASYLWQDGSVEPTYTVRNEGLYTVVVALNGCDTTGQIKVVFITKPIVNIGNDTTLCVSDKILLDASYPGASYKWQDGSTDASFLVDKAGVYIVNAANTCGTTTDSTHVAYKNCDCKFYVPSAFTPNGDGRNDIFKPSYKCFFSNYQINIYNRFGQLIYSSQDAEKGWDGTFNGSLQPTGTYIWKIEYSDKLLQKTERKNGTIVLIR